MSVCATNDRKLMLTKHLMASNSLHALRTGEFTYRVNVQSRMDGFHSGLKKTVKLRAKDADSNHVAKGWSDPKQQGRTPTHPCRMRSLS